MNRRPCLIDGHHGDCRHLPDGLYVFQNIRTTGCSGSSTAYHLTILNEASRRLMGFGVQCDARTLDSRIATLLGSNGYPADALSFVTVRQYLSGELLILANDIFPYRRPQLRSIHPKGGLVDYDLPFPEYSSSLTESACQIAKARMRKSDPSLGTVLRRNLRGEVVSADGAPLFIIAEGEVRGPQPPTPSVEYETAVSAIMKAGLPFAVRTLDTAQIAAAEELFYADHRGITSLHSAGGHNYLHLGAERIARFF